MRIILFIIITLFLANPVFAEETIIEASEVPNWLNNFYQKTNEKLIIPVEQLIDSMKQKVIEEKSQELLEKTQKAIEEKQEELLDKAQEKIKQEIKKSAKNWIQNRMEWIKGILNPLKIKIQQGSNLIREWIDSIK